VYPGLSELLAVGLGTSYVQVVLRPHAGLGTDEPDFAVDTRLRQDDDWGHVLYHRTRVGHVPLAKCR
jgi:hypothetical protein